MDRLTRPQDELLAEAAAEGGTKCVVHYKPAQALIRKGLAEWITMPRGYVRLVATPLGRALRSEQEGK